MCVCVYVPQGVDRLPAPKLPPTRHRCRCHLKTHLANGFLIRVAFNTSCRCLCRCLCLCFPAPLGSQPDDAINLMKVSSKGARNDGKGSAGQRNYGIVLSQLGNLPELSTIDNNRLGKSRSKSKDRCERRRSVSDLGN